MRTDAAAFATKNLAAAKQPRFVVQIEFEDSSIYLSSHSDITGLAGDTGALTTEVPADLLTESSLLLDAESSIHLSGVLMEPSIASQRLNPDQGRAEIGAAAFTVADVNRSFTDELRTLHDSGQGLRDRRCRFFLGYRGLTFSEFQLVGTQNVKQATFDKGAYRISCNDIQRSARKDIFDLAQTTLAQTLEVADTTVYVSNTTGFEQCWHGPSYSDAANSTVGYVKIKEEVIRYTGVTTTSFTGCTRGVLGTAAGRYVVDGSTAASRREKVSEYAYLELPGPKLLYAILTGVLHGNAETLPSKWHLGIPTDLVRLTDFTVIGPDLWDTANDAVGVVLRFEGLTKTDGKAFYETEICRLLGLFTPVYATGELGLKRMTRVLTDASGVATLDESNSVMVGELEHDMESLHNAFAIAWNWTGRDYSRLTTYVDADSANKHGLAPTMELKFKGLYGGRHTDGLVFKTLDAVRDRYSAPPVRLKVDALHRLNPLEVGDVVRVHHTTLRDYSGPDDHIDRAMEIQGVTVNHRTGNVSLDLFGSTSRASIESPTESTVALPDAFYTAQGTNLATVMTITAGVVSGGPYTLAGGADLTASTSTWYYDGDLTIPSGVTVNLSGNVQLRVKGYLTIDGTLTGIGGGLAGVADNGTATVIAGNPGYVGNSRGHDGIVRVNITDDKVKLRTKPPALTQAKNASFPLLQLEVSGNTLTGLPTDLRGTGGGPGGKIVHDTGTFYANGGTGGNGGAGLCTLSRGFGIGANATINLSGNNTAAAGVFSMMNGSKSIEAFPGAGGAGGPGAFLLLIDGSLLSVPDLAGRFVSRTGICALPVFTTAMGGIDIETFKPKDDPFAGYVEEPSVISAMDLSFSASRIQYVPAPETAAEDVATDAPVGTYATASPFGISASAASTTVTTGTVTASLVGATATTYAWTRLSGSTSITATSPSAAATTFGATGVASGTTVSAVFRCTINGTYTVDIPVDCTNGSNTSLSVSASPSSVAKTEDAATITTATVTAAAAGGSGAITFAWTKVSGGAITATSGATAATAFTAATMGANEARSALFRCTATDAAAATATVDVTVTITRAAMSVAITPTEIYKWGTGSPLSTSTVTAAATGGTGGISYAWTKQSGDTITINSPSSASTTFSAATLAPGETRVAIFRCTATDTLAATAYRDIEVTIERSEGTSGGIPP